MKSRSLIRFRQTTAVAWTVPIRAIECRSVTIKTGILLLKIVFTEKSILQSRGAYLVRQSHHSARWSQAGHRHVRGGGRLANSVCCCYCVVIATFTCSWRYATLDEDVGFAIYYDARGSCYDDVKQMEIVYPYIRLECTEVPSSGSIMTEFPGRCALLDIERRVHKALKCRCD